MLTGNYSTHWRICGDASALRVIIERIEESIAFPMRPQIAGQRDGEHLTLWLFEPTATIGVARILRQIVDRPGVSVHELAPEAAPEPATLIAGAAFRVLLQSA